MDYERKKANYENSQKPWYEKFHIGKSDYSGGFDINAIRSVLSETSADELESVLNGQTTVEPSDEGGGNSIAYQVLQQMTVNNYNISESDTLWAKT